MYETHPSFTPPPPDAVLWRYLDFTKFVSLLDKKALFFSRSDKLGDPFEGSFSRANTDVFYDPPFDVVSRNIRESARDMRSFVLVNSWHEGDHESAAMWKLYAGERRGIAIKTDFKSLSRSFTTNNRIFIGRVSYIDYETTPIAECNMLLPFLHKRRAFTHEAEVRAIELELPLEDAQKRWPPVVDLTTPIHNVGVYREVDLAALVQEVLVAPYADEWLTELVQSVAAQYCLAASVRKSSLADNPTW